MAFPDREFLLNRCSFFRDCGVGLGLIALWHLLSSDAWSATSPDFSTNPLAPKPPQFPATAKNVILLFMDGGPSQLDLFDPKSEMKIMGGISRNGVPDQRSQISVHQAHRQVLGQPARISTSWPKHLA
jgi:hypothetical protein